MSQQTADMSSMWYRRPVQGKLVLQSRNRGGLEHVGKYLISGVSSRRLTIRYCQCLACKKVHIPMQVGPTIEALERIEAVRAQDLKAHCEHKDKKRARQTKTAAKTKKAARTSAEGASQRPFGVSKAFATT